MELLLFAFLLSLAILVILKYANHSLKNYPSYSYVPTTVENREIIGNLSVENIRKKLNKKSSKF